MMDPFTFGHFESLPLKPFAIAALLLQAAWEFYLRYRINKSPTTDDMKRLNIKVTVCGSVGPTMQSRHDLKRSKL